jgi:hypothetical protein
VVSPWFGIGFDVVSPWFASGFGVVFSWFCSGLLMVHLWFLLVCFWTSAGLSGSFVDHKFIFSLVQK